MNQIKIGFIAITVMFSQLGFAQSSPVPMLEQSANQIIATLKQHKSMLKNNHQLIYQSIEQHLLPNVDVSGMSRSVLGRQAWSKATPSEKREFTQAFTQLLIHTYASPLAEVF